ncbi:hypothetical protein BDQ17DRAFT_1329796 [Cyathus striatus]|nr:hypothetical protein BDQ17DRAFT_1329796 [Cyathus striatus]
MVSQVARFLARLYLPGGAVSSVGISATFLVAEAGAVTTCIYFYHEPPQLRAGSGLVDASQLGWGIGRQSWELSFIKLSRKGLKQKIADDRYAYRRCSVVLGRVQVVLRLPRYLDCVGVCLSLRSGPRSETESYLEWTTGLRFTTMK